MTNVIQRRDFVKAVSLLGASLAVDGQLSAQSTRSNERGVEIRNDFLTVSFDSVKGTFDVRRNDGTSLVMGGTSRANCGSNKRSMTSDRYRRTQQSIAFKDQLGAGKRMVIIAHDLDGELDFEMRLSLYDRLSAITFETICTNISPHGIALNSVEPLRLVNEEGGTFCVPGVSKCLTNGSMYYDTGTVHEFGTPYQQHADTGIKGIKPSNKSLSQQQETVRSWWNSGLFGGYDKPGVAVGYLENDSCFGQLFLSKTSPDQVSFVAESLYAPQITLGPGHAISSNRLMIATGADPYAALEAYATAVGRVRNARTSSIVNGWCSWFYTLANVSEEEVLRNTAFAARHLKPFGLEYIQIDEGYQRWHGDWEGNDRFPHGMKWLADQIKGYGFKPGLWLAPYVISEPTEVFQKHPEWLVKNSDGSPKRVGNWPSEDAEVARGENPKRYCLDITHPDAARWLHDLVDTIANRWGYEMIKVDFVAWSILSADRYFDSTSTSAQVYRKGFEIMRAAAGERCHLLDCGPGSISAGLIDSMRIELDSGYGFSKDVWKTYFTDPTCSMVAAAKRYYFHKRTWINDADHVCLGLLSDEQSEAAATIIALSGGNLISGDRLVELSPSKLAILKKTIPSCGEAARPVDLFDSDAQSVFALKFEKPFGEWTVVGLFNSSLTEPVEKRFPLERLWLDRGRQYLAFDFWKQQFVGAVLDEIKVVVPPGSVTLLALHERTGKPQWISSDRHVCQGAIEIEDVKWSDKDRTLSGISLGPPGTSHNVSVYLPEPRPWTWGGYVLFHDYDSYSVRLVDAQIVQVHVRFENCERVRWQIEYDDFLNG